MQTCSNRWDDWGDNTKSSHKSNYDPRRWDDGNLLPGGKTLLIWGPQEAQKRYIVKFGSVCASNQLGNSLQAVNIHHPTDLDDKSICGMIWP